MNKYKIGALIFFLGAFLCIAPACSRKSGCPANEALQTPVNRKGELKTGKGSKSGLFDKKMRKRMGK
ncbi:MAG: hypothetical protein R2792_15470 [Saprospiraceae bacterium]